MEISRIATSKPLSDVLLANGVDRKTADMFYPIDGSSFPEVCDNGDNMQADYPTWSLDALINLLTGWDVCFHFEGNLWYCQCYRMVGREREAIQQCDFGKIEAICRVIIFLKQRGDL